MNDANPNEGNRSVVHDEAIIGIIVYGFSAALFLMVSVGLLLKEEHVNYYWDCFLSGMLFVFLFVTTQAPPAASRINSSPID